MNVFGIIFDNKLNWNNHIAKAISKVNSAQHCVRLIKYYFTPEELIEKITFTQSYILGQKFGISRALAQS